MANKYYSRRSARKVARKSRRNFIVTIFIIVLLGYLTLVWILPFLINSIGLIKNAVQPPKKAAANASVNSSLAPPVLNIPYEATNSAQINIKGYATPQSKVKLYLDDAAQQTIDAGNNGDFNFQNIVLSLGTNNISAKTIDGSGNESLASKTIKVVYDNQTPTLTLTAPEDNKTVQGGDKKVTVSGNTDPNNRVFINETQIILDKDGNFSSDQVLNDGDNIISVKAVSPTSNSTEIQRKVTYSTSPSPSP